MTSTVDLHSHTNVSDGELTPSQLVDRAIRQGVKHLAITDHETVAGIESAIQHAKGKPIRIIPGIEIGCNEKELKFTDIHILGLFLDHTNEQLLSFCERVVKERILQKKEMIKKLQSFGYSITFEEVARYATVSFGRPHVARVLHEKYPKEFPTINTVFEKYLGTGKPAYVHRGHTSIQAAVTMIHGAGGKAVLAHPGVFKKDDATELISFFAKCGGDGVEVYYPYDLVIKKDVHAPFTQESSNDLNKYFQTVATKNRLAYSGGSDFHGSIRKTVEVGSQKVPESVLDSLQQP